MFGASKVNRINLQYMPYIVTLYDPEALIYGIYIMCRQCEHCNETILSKRTTKKQNRNETTFVVSCLYHHSFDKGEGTSFGWHRYMHTSNDIFIEKIHRRARGWSIMSMFLSGIKIFHVVLICWCGVLV